MKRIYLVAPAMIWLAACGPGVQKVSDDEGTAAQFAMNDQATAKAPENMPEFAQVYPRARVTTVIANPDMPGKGMVVMQSTDARDKVIAFYRANGEKAGLKSVGEMVSGDAYSLTMQKGEDMTTAFSVTVGQDYETNGSTVTLHYQTP